jgi:uncharacterized membrane protein HdeD (DUF308 family)
MDPIENPIPPRANRAEHPRHPGWAVLVGVLGIVFVIIGVTLIGMSQAPVARPRVVVTGFVLIVAGLVLLPVAWLGRRHGGSD